MASDVTTQTGTPATVPAATIIHTDQITATGAHAQLVKLDLGVAGSTSLVSGTVPVSAASLPLPTGAALEAGHLATIDGKIPALGQALAAASVPVILPAATITTLTPPAAISGFALEAGHLATIDTRLDVALSTRLKPADTLAGVTALGSITSALPAGSNVIGHVIADTGSTTAVTGNVTVVQPTGTNLHVVVDSAPTTPITAAALPLPANAAVESSGNLAAIVAFNMGAHTDLLTSILRELRINSELLQAGLNVPGDLDLQYRTDSSFLQ